MDVRTPRQTLGSLALATGGAWMMLLVPGAAFAVDPSADPSPDPWAFVVPKQPAEPADDAEAGDAKPTDKAAVPDLSGIDWSPLATTPDLAKPTPRRATGAAQLNRPELGTAWSQSDKPNGFSALTVKQPVLPFWDTRVGADFNVAGQGQPPTPLPEKLATDGHLSQSSGTAWAAATAPGLGPVWDKTAVDARLDPAQDQGKLGTSISKSIPLGATTLMLQGGYSITDQSALPAWLSAGRPQYSYGADQSAKLQFSQTGTSLLAGQSLSPAEDRWLKSVGAEQSLLGGVSVNGTISESATGMLNKSLTAGFRKTW